MIKNKGGFTLIEIIVVLIISGVLAAIAVPSYFRWIERSSSTVEAMAYLKSYKDIIEGCILAHPGSAYTTCAYDAQPPDTIHFTGSLQHVGGLLLINMIMP